MLRRFVTDLCRGRLAGHPIHLMLVHFPSALFPTSLIFDAMGLILHKNSLAEAAFYSMAGGLLGGFAAALFGAVDYFKLAAENPAWRKASKHALLSLAWLLLFTTALGLRRGHYPDFELATWPQLILSTLGVFGLLFSNYLGGELVLKHRLGSE